MAWTAPRIEGWRSKCVRPVIGEPPSLAAFFQLWRKNDGEFLRDEGELGVRRVSYREAADQAVRFATRLRTANIAQGDRIVIWSENRAEWVTSLWGSILAGVVVVPVDFRSSAAMVARIADIVQAKALLTGNNVAGEFPATLPVWPLANVFDPQFDVAAEFSPAPPDQLAEILFTSGATGDPKGVTLTHRNILANLKPIDHGIEKYRKYMGPFSPIRFLNLLPLSHMFGQSMAALIPPMIAGTVISMPGQSPAVVARTVKRGRISVMVCVPQMLELLREYVLQRCPRLRSRSAARSGIGRWWQYRRVHRLLGLEVLGVRGRRGAAGSGAWSRSGASWDTS